MCALHIPFDFLHFVTDSFYHFIGTTTGSSTPTTALTAETCHDDDNDDDDGGSNDTATVTTLLSTSLVVRASRMKTPGYPNSAPFFFC